MSKKKPKATLEARLLELAQGSDPRDKKKRPRVELLAATLWSRALNGDKDSLKMLLDRLPRQSGFHAEPVSTESMWKPTTYDELTNALKALVEGGLVPIELFEMYRKKPEDAVEH